jgi:hypothetical protein
MSKGWNRVSSFWITRAPRELPPMDFTQSFCIIVCHFIQSILVKMQHPGFLTSLVQLPPNSIRHTAPVTVSCHTHLLISCRTAKNCYIWILILCSIVASACFPASSSPMTWITFCSNVGLSQSDTNVQKSPQQLLEFINWAYVRPPWPRSKSRVVIWRNDWCLNDYRHRLGPIKRKDVPHWQIDWDDVCDLWSFCSEHVFNNDLNAM